jgi:moderate conductance mechanosensitive channel
MDQIFSREFLSKSINILQDWLITELPGLIFLSIGIFLLFKVTRISLGKLKKSLVTRADVNESVDAAEAEKRINTLVGISEGLLKISLITIYIMMLLGKFGVEIGPLLASAGILGLAIGFGAQELVRDFISGFFILLENRVRAGDVAVINGTGGLVEKIELRTITLRDFSGTVHIFQNGKINTIANMTKEWSAAVFDIGVAYKENVEMVMEVMKQVGDDLQKDPEFTEKIIAPIEVFGLDQFADSALVIKARIKTKPIMQWVVGREYRKRLKAAFDLHNIEIPFPHTTVYWGEKIEPLKLKVEERELAKITS